MDPIAYMIEARRLLMEALGTEILETEMDTSIYQLKIKFNQGSILFIRYNKYNEYAYQVIFSKKKNDFIRYDNFDDKWKGSTKPHHIHSRFDNPIVESPMIGVPKHDMPILINFLKKAMFKKLV